MLAIKRVGEKVRKRFLYYITILILFSFLFSSCATTNNANLKAIELLLQEGKTQLVEELYEEAIISYEKVLLIDPDNIEGLYGLARTYLLAGDISRSAQVIHTLIDIDTLNAYSLTKTYASLLYDDGEKDKALSTLYDLYYTNVYDLELAMLLIEKYMENENTNKAYEIAIQAYQYHYNNQNLLNNIAQITEKGNLPDKESWGRIAQ